MPNTALPSAPCCSTVQGSGKSLCSSSYKMSHFSSVEEPYTTSQILFFCPPFFFPFLISPPIRHKSDFGLVSSPSTRKPLSPALFKGMKEWESQKTRGRVGKREQIHVEFQIPLPWKYLALEHPFINAQIVQEATEPSVFHLP